MAVLDHSNFRPERPEVTNAIVDYKLARDPTENRGPLFLITRWGLTRAVFSLALLKLNSMRGKCDVNHRSDNISTKPQGLKTRQAAAAD